METTKIMKIAITGATGLVGSRIVELLHRDFEFIPLSSSEFDISNAEKVTEKLRTLDFDMFLHLAAYTNVDGAENERELAHRINVEGTKNVFDAVTAKGKQLIYLSTDFVFDGTHPPYYEDSVHHPLGYYAQTKYEGEQVVKDNAMIVRIAYPYRASFEPKKDFVRTLKSLLEQGRELRMISDASITPTFIDDIAMALAFLFKNYTPEIYHIVGGSSLSPYEAALKIADRFKLNKSLVKSTTYAEYSVGKAPRSQWSTIKTNKNTFYKMKTFEEGLAELH